MTIREMIAKVYAILGEISQQQLPMAVVMENLESVTSRVLQEMGISDRNFFLASFPITVTSTQDDYQSFPSDFGKEIYLEYRLDGIYFSPMDLVNLTAQDDIGYRQRPCASVYGTPPHLKIRNLIADNISLRLWYEPAMDAPVKWSQELSTQIRRDLQVGMIWETAWLSIPHCQISDNLKTGLVITVGGEAQKHVDLRRNLLYRPAVQGRVYKRPYRSGGGIRVTR